MALPFQFKAETVISEKRTTQEALDTIKNWLKETTLPKIQDEFIILFLISCENDIDVTKKAIEAYFRIKNEVPQIFDNYDVSGEELKSIMDVIGLCVVPKRMKDNRVVVCARLLDTNYRRCNIIAGIKLSLIPSLMIQIKNPVKEIVVIIDLKGVGFMHLTCLKMGAIISYLRYIQEALPIKLHTIHILNSNYVFDKTLNLFKIFIKSELLDLLHTHPPGTNIETFHKNFVPASYLPEEYGGDLASFDEIMKETQKEISQMQPFFDAEEQLRKTYKGQKRKI